MQTVGHPGIVELVWLTAQGDGHGCDRERVLLGVGFTPGVECQWGAPGSKELRAMSVVFGRLRAARGAMAQCFRCGWSGSPTARDPHRSLAGRRKRT